MATTVLGIDPGSLITGYGIIKGQGQKIDLIDMGVIKPGQAKDPYQRLQIIYKLVSELIAKYKPDTFAIEAPFFGKNVQSMLKLGRAQGVAIAAAMQYNLTTTEYSPKSVKQAVTGNGNASKEQIWSMLQKILNIKEAPQFFDATDATAVALCHYYSLQNPLLIKGKKKDWKSFVEKNADRIVK